MEVLALKWTLAPALRSVVAAVGAAVVALVLALVTGTPKKEVAVGVAVLLVEARTSVGTAA